MKFIFCSIQSGIDMRITESHVDYFYFLIQFAIFYLCKKLFFDTTL